MDGAALLRAVVPRLLSCCADMLLGIVLWLEGIIISIVLIQIEASTSLL
jgi:hypothetical protein